MDWLRFGIAALLILGGIFTAISAAVGVFKFKECLTRMHAAAMGDSCPGSGPDGTCPALWLFLHLFETSACDRLFMAGKPRIQSFDRSDDV